MSGQNDLLSLFKTNNPRVNEEVVSIRDKCADPIFKPEDIALAENEPAKLIRYYFVTKNIGYSKFNELHRRYSMEIGKRSTEADRDRGNLRKALVRETITWDLLVNKLFPVLGLRLEDTVLKLVDLNNNDHFTLSTVKATDRISRHFPDDIPNIKDMVINARKTDTGEHVVIKDKE